MDEKDDSDPFVTVWIKQNRKEEFKQVRKTEVIHNNHNPDFINLLTVNYNFEKNQTLSFRVEDMDKETQNSQPIGSVDVKFGTVITAKGNVWEAEIKNGTLVTGKIFIKYKYLDDPNFDDGEGEPTAPATPGFLHFLKAGWHISMSFAIDMTGSNGKPRDPTSLHFFDRSNKKGYNNYEVAAHNVGKILEQYDTDKKFPLIGFGAITPENKTSRSVSHNFNLSKNPDGLVNGTTGVLDAYRAVFEDKIKLYGPTCFAPFLEHFIKRVEAKGPASLEYNVFVILTDGLIQDMDEVREQVVKASQLPISLLIIGIGSSEELEDMVFLDSDGANLTDLNGNQAARDICQFVKFNNYAENIDSLTDEVIGEIPKQMNSYFKLKEIVPIATPTTVIPPAQPPVAVIPKK